jgi:hypothetical protein
MTAVARIALVLAAAHVVVGVVMSFIENPEGPAGGVLYALLYALPLLLIGLALRSSRSGFRTAAGLGAFILGTFYVMTVAENWAFYSPEQAVFAAAITVPTVAVDIATIWVTLLHRPARPMPPAPTAA